MGNRAEHREGENRSEKEPHDRFLELCALSTSGELSEKERKDLHAHLAGCPVCQQALKEFEAAVDIAVPLLHSVLSVPEPSVPDSIPAEAAEATPLLGTALMETAKAEQARVEQISGLNFSHRNGHRRMQVNWNYVWMPFAAAVVLTVALGIYSFQAGKHKGLQAVRTAPATVDPRVEALEQQISDAGHERELFKAQLADRDRMIAELRHQVEAQSVTLSEMKSAQVNLEQTLQSDEAKNQQIAEERSNLSQQFDAAQASLQKTQAVLDSLQQQRLQDESRAESLEVQIEDLHGQIRDREQALDKQEELLAHDRDIRELMGARELYIAEVYDVARDGQTKKPYGRVFYTTGRSLVFYAYDLDQQSGIKRTSTFQAWGSRGLDRQQATSLGIFFEDNAAKKRWVLKADDPKKLAQIDAVFVTVEPNGGSLKPSGKPLLFAYLKVEPNHP